MSAKMRARVIIIAAVAALLGHCAKERDPVDRVQPYAIDKAYFIGEDFTDTTDDPEFYSRNFVIDVGYGASSSGLFTSTYADQVGRIKWQITEDYLIGRAAYERIEGTDGKGEPKRDAYGSAIGSATNDGIIAAMFAIDSHFDIVNAYNPTTGEKLNVIEENDQDRPWYERQYMRVDWSKNLNTDSYDFDTLSLMGVYGGIEYEPVSYFVEDPSDPDAPLFALEEGYFDVTTKAFAEPKEIDLSGMGWGIDSYPACFLPDEFFGGSEPVGSCNPVEITLRHSFVRVDRDGDGVEDSDYEPREYDGWRFQAYGGFYTDRFGYDRGYGMTDAEWHRMLNRLNIWERSHYYDEPETMTGWTPCNTEETTPAGFDPNRDDDEDGTADECASVTALSGFKGSRCDVFKRRCTLPYRARKTKPIPFYYTDTGNSEYFEPSARALHDWDVALRSAVQTARYTECVKTEVNGTRGRNEQKAVCQEAYPVWHGQMDDQQDAIALALEVDDCRTGRAYKGEDCRAVADAVAARRGLRGEGVIETAKMPEMLTLCHSPVAFDDPKICGPDRLPEGVTRETCIAAKNLGGDDVPASLQAVLDVGDLKNVKALVKACNTARRVRHGDLRYHVLNVIDAPQEPSPWGIMTSSIDPLTGETIASNCNVWSHVTDLYAQKIVDQMRLIKGDLDVDDVTEADYVADWVQAADAASKGGVFGTVSRTQVSNRLSEFLMREPNPDLLDEIEAGEVNGRPISATERALAEEIKERMDTFRAEAATASTQSAIYEARRRAARGTEFEAGLMTDAVMQQRGVDEMALNQSVMDFASPLRGGNPSIQRDVQLMMQNHLPGRHACMLEADHGAETPAALKPLADIIEEKFGAFGSGETAEKIEKIERIRRYLAQNMHYGVITHEIGHTIAHRHNFVSSSNAWAYMPQYWQLRTRDGRETDECHDVTSDGAACVGPRYYDPLTETESGNLIHMFMASSIMEYQGDVTQDFVGTGIWDFAAARMFYGDVVSVISDENFNADMEKKYTAYARNVYGFGGIAGIGYTYDGEEIHYSALQNRIGMIKDCREVESLEAFKPGRYNEEESGEWHPVLDGKIVAPDRGRYTRCRQPEVDYVNWSDTESGRYDDEDRVVEPYAFGTDSWADLGNISVYRHDNGADPYEIFNYMITQKELSYIFDKYRRGRSDFSVRYASNRSLARYNAKIRDGAKGLGLYRNIYEQVAMGAGNNPDIYWPAFISAYGERFRTNILAATYAFDYFARELARPEAGPHGYAKVDRDRILRSGEPVGDRVYETGPFSLDRESLNVNIPNGPTGYFGLMSPGGERLENQLADDQGEFDRDYTMNCGSYYDKLNVAMLLTESVDNFISSDRTDFYDPRFRSVSMADLFPDGYRRLIANALTDDEYLKGPRIATDDEGTPLTDRDGYPLNGIGWTSWWGETPVHCFPEDGLTTCGDAFGDLGDAAPEYTAPVDSQIGWEQQKFLIAWTLLYLPENEKQNWLDQLRLWELGRDADPGFENRLELHVPDGRVYVAKTLGTEEIFGRTVQKGIAARVLEYANELLNEAYETEPLSGADGRTIGYRPVLDGEGQPVVRFDPRMIPDGLVFEDDPETAFPGLSENCTDTDSSGCTCNDNWSCMMLRNYLSVPAFLRQAIDAYDMADPELEGIWN